MISLRETDVKLMKTGVPEGNLFRSITTAAVPVFIDIKAIYVPESCLILLYVMNI